VRLGLYGIFWLCTRDLEEIQSDDEDKK
jgi:hypothetical protein